MKAFISLLAFALLTVSGLAVPVSFEWDHEAMPGDTYVLKSGAIEFPATDKKTITVDLAPGVHEITVRAKSVSGIFSGPSTPLPVTVPNTPGNLRIKIIVDVQVQQVQGQ